VDALFSLDRDWMVFDGAGLGIDFQPAASIVGAAPGWGRASISWMIRKLKSGEFRLYSRKKDASTGKRRNLGTFKTLEQAKQHEREVQYFKRHS
jgi:hypothetical protein